jgi:hypothetical protein
MTKGTACLPADIIALLFIKQRKRHGDAQFYCPLSWAFIDADAAMYAKVRIGYRWGFLFN